MEKGGHESRRRIGVTRRRNSRELATSNKRGRTEYLPESIILSSPYINREF